MEKFGLASAKSTKELGIITLSITCTTPLLVWMSVERGAASPSKNTPPVTLICNESGSEFGPGESVFT